jgi:hypothetical protein
MAYASNKRMPMTKPDERLGSGLVGLDQILHGLRLGDNVVLQVDRFEDYLPFVRAYGEAAVRQGHRLIYFRFARHQPIFADREDLEIVELRPEIGFERFLSEILDVIETAGVGAYYVFDCLSELLVDWYSDRMVANFFMVTCPFLYRLDTVAYFALIKQQHTALALDAIIETAQVVLTVYRNEKQLFVKPLKVEGRHSRTMYMLHEWRGEEFIPVSNSATIFQVFSKVAHPWLDFSIHRPGLWKRSFMQAQSLLKEIAEGRGAAEATDCFDRLSRMAITRQEHFARLVKTYFGLEDLVRVFQRMIGTGLIGGKALGMLLARAVVHRNQPELATLLEDHDSFFVGSDVFYTYLVRNDCWWLCRRGQGEALLDRASEARDKILTGDFPEDIRQQFAEMLSYFGQSPLIVRSSSLLEDNFGNSFSGKYDSVFCANQGKPAERLEAFVDAVRQVYASAMNPEALFYRQHRGLLEQDEQMALLVQRVSGAEHHGRFYPQLAGVGFSFNPFVWCEGIEASAGMLRLVFGLGTRAVDRTEDDYPRLVALNAPEKVPQAREDATRYSQKRVDLLDLLDNSLKTELLENLLQDKLELPLELFISPDEELMARAREAGVKLTFPYVLDFRGLFRRTGFVKDMRALLQTIEEGYECPVDVEFTVNFFDSSTYQINLVQCRPFQVQVRGRDRVLRPPVGIEEAKVLLKSKGPILGQSALSVVDRIVYVVPSAYAALPEQERYAVARLVGQLAGRKETEEQQIMLVGPGRWGTSTSSLGVPVAFPEISGVSVICEVALMHDGLVPDLSLGSHFFNDLVELEMTYLAVYPGKEGNSLNEAFFREYRNCLIDLVPDAGALASVVRVVDRQFGGPGICLHSDSRKQAAVCYLD